MFFAVVFLFYIIVIIILQKIRDMKKYIILLLVIALAFISSLCIYKVCQRSKYDNMITERLEALSDEEGGATAMVVCRCHVDEYVCYGGNAISFRPLCGSGFNIICKDVFDCPR